MIFITENDKFGMGIPVYHVERKITVFFGHLSMDSERVLINFDNFLIIIEKYEKMYKGENIML